MFFVYIELYEYRLLRLRLDEDRETLHAAWFQTATTSSVPTRLTTTSTA